MIAVGSVVDDIHIVRVAQDRGVRWSHDDLTTGELPSHTHTHTHTNTHKHTQTLTHSHTHTHTYTHTHMYTAHYISAFFARFLYLDLFTDGGTGTAEGYLLAISPSTFSVCIVGADASGAFYGSVTLGAIVNSSLTTERKRNATNEGLQSSSMVATTTSNASSSNISGSNINDGHFLKHGNGNVALPAYMIVDFPDLPLRGYEVEMSFTEAPVPWSVYLSSLYADTES